MWLAVSLAKRLWDHAARAAAASTGSIAVIADTFARLADGSLGLLAYIALVLVVTLLHLVDTEHQRLSSSDA